MIYPFYTPFQNIYLFTLLCNSGHSLQNEVTVLRIYSAVAERVVAVSWIEMYICSYGSIGWLPCIHCSLTLEQFHAPLRAHSW